MLNEVCEIKSLYTYLQPCSSSTNNTGTEKQKSPYLNIYHRLTNSTLIQYYKWKIKLQLLFHSPKRRSARVTIEKKAETRTLLLRGRKVQGTFPLLRSVQCRRDEAHEAWWSCVNSLSTNFTYIPHIALRSHLQQYQF